MLNGKTVVVGVTGGIAAYKTAGLVSRLSQSGAEVHVILTENAAKFITPMTFETLSKQPCLIDTFERKGVFDVEHVELAKKADVFLIAPATANTVAKIANGMADNMLTTTFLASTCPKLVAPSMNTRMFENPVTQDNLRKLASYGVKIISPAVGDLACGDTGAGKMPEPEELYDWIEREIARPKEMTGKKILVTAGATRESMDPVRFITNHSTGKMGFALAKECMLRGADVTLIRLAATAKAPRFCRIVDAVSAADLYEAVTTRAAEQDAVLMAAAVADYAPKNVADQKVKKKDGDLSIPLVRTKDILAELGRMRPEGTYLCGFSMETENLIENSRKKLEKKNVDMIVANNLKDHGAGFGTDTNLCTLITKEGCEELPLLSKEDVAKAIVDRIAEKIV